MGGVEELQKFVRKLLFSRALVAGAASHDLALCIAVHEGHRLREARQLVGSGEGAS